MYIINRMRYADYTAGTDILFQCRIASKTQVKCSSASVKLSVSNFVKFFF